MSQAPSAPAEAFDRSPARVWRRPSGRDRRAASPTRAYGSLERAFAACGLIAAAGTTGGAVLAVHGYGAAPLLFATCLALLLCAGLGILAMERVIRFQRGEVARVYANALEAPRRAVFERRRAEATRMEVLGLAVADLVQSLRMKILGGDHVGLWAVAMRRALDERAETSRTLAAVLGEDAHAIAAAAAAARRAETEIAADVEKLFAHAGRAAEATTGMEDEAEALLGAVRQTTVQLHQASALAASLAENAMAARRGVASVDEVSAQLLHAAGEVKAVLLRAGTDGLTGGAGAAHAGEAGHGFTVEASDGKGAADSGRIALEALLQAVRELRENAAVMSQTVSMISEGVQTHGALGQALSTAMSHQIEDVARIAAKAGVAQGEIVALQLRATHLQSRELGLGAGPAARRAVERLPGHAEAIAKILRDLPSFEPTK